MPRYLVYYDAESFETIEADHWAVHGDIIEFFTTEKFGIPNKNQQMNRTVYIVNSRNIAWVDVKYNELEKVTSIQ